jgi:hypothetical protein
MTSISITNPVSDYLASSASAVAAQSRHERDLRREQETADELIPAANELRDEVTAAARAPLPMISEYVSGRIGAGDPRRLEREARDFRLVLVPVAPDRDRLVRVDARPANHARRLESDAEREWLQPTLVRPGDPVNAQLREERRRSESKAESRTGVQGEAEPATSLGVAAHTARRVGLKRATRQGLHEADAEHRHAPLGRDVEVPRAPGVEDALEAYAEPEVRGGGYVGGTCVQAESRPLTHHRTRTQLERASGPRLRLRHELARGGEQRQRTEPCDRAESTTHVHPSHTAAPREL